MLLLELSIYGVMVANTSMDAVLATFTRCPYASSNASRTGKEATFAIVCLIRTVRLVVKDGDDRCVDGMELPAGKNTNAAGADANSLP